MHYKESIYPRENYILSRAAFSSPFKISAHFLFNRGIPSKTDSPHTASTHITVATKEMEAVYSGKL